LFSPGAPIVNRVLSRFVLLGCLGVSLPAFGHEPHVCLPGVNDVPAMLAEHTEQADLVAGVFDAQAMFVKGGALGDTRWSICDGFGRPATTGGGAHRTPDESLMSRASGPEAVSCQGCHGQPRTAGSGDFVANTFNGGELLLDNTFSLGPEVSNERDTTGMFGAGYLELLAREMTVELKQQLAASTTEGWQTFTTKGVSFEVDVKNGEVVAARGINNDLIVRPFGAGGTKASIRQFTVEAFNRHHGLQAEERYDRFLGDPDFDQDGVQRELTIGDLTVVALWQAMLDRPQVQMPEDDPRATVDVNQGKKLFARVGCTDCHVAQMTLNNRTFCEPGLYNDPGIFGSEPGDADQRVCTVLNWADDDSTKTDDLKSNPVPADTPLPLATYTDLKRHRMCDDPAKVADPITALCNEQLAEDRPSQDGYPGEQYFLTADLWQVGESAPYGHNGHYPSLSSIIMVHAGEAREARDAYAALPKAQQLKVIKFLQTLKIFDQVLRVNDG
jgi:mono/diheme cytochrome c family protein